MDYSMLGRLIAMLMTVPQAWGTLVDLVEKLASANGVLWLRELRIFLRKQPCWAAQQPVSILRQIFVGKKINIPATTKRRTIAQMKSLFPGGIYFDFNKSECDVPGVETPEISTDMYEMSENGDFRNIFGGFGLNLDLLCLTQEQIIVWVGIHTKRLRTDGYGTFFLFKEGGEFFVARVNVDSAGLGVDVYRFSDEGVWRGGYRHRFVVPQLDPIVT